MIDIFIHSLDSSQVVCGRKLVAGETTRKSDYYESFATGRWEHPKVDGFIIQPGCTTVWVRSIDTE